MIHRFTVRAAIDPQTLPRVIGQLGRQWVTPDALTATWSDGEMLIEFVTSELERATAERVEGTLRSCVLVRAVDVRELPTPAAVHEQFKGGTCAAE